MTLAQTLHSWREPLAANLAVQNKQWHYRGLPSQDKAHPTPLTASKSSTTTARASLLSAVNHQHQQ
jgi:hypothetical protein